MQPGCGLKVRRIKGRWYVYVWHYDGEGRRKVEAYAGPAGVSRTNERAVRSLFEHESRARAALDRRIAKYRVALSRFGAG